MGGYTAIYDWPTSRAEIYDPKASSWTATESMKTGRTGASATVLRDGRVLVVGGLTARLHALDRAEIYNPETGVWSAAARLPDHRFSHSASLLPNGRVLIAGGIVNGTISRSTLIYDPSANRWKYGPSMRGFHALHAGAMLPDKRLLIAGGYGDPPETYSPRTHLWTAAGSTARRTLAVLMPLTDGTVLLAAGESAASRDLRTSEVFDPLSDSWTRSGMLHTRRNAAAAVRLPTGQVLIAGGEQVTGHVLGSAEIYDPAVHSWEGIAPLMTGRSGAIAAVLSDGRALLCGGVDMGIVLSSCEIYSPPSYGA